jgi:hypothetical protein
VAAACALTSAPFSPSLPPSLQNTPLGRPGSGRTAAGKGFHIIVLALFGLGGYVMWRGRRRHDVLADDFDFDTSPATRHLVDMRRRVDRAQVERWLAEQEEKDNFLKRPDYAGGGAGTGGAGTGTTTPGLR